MAHKLFKTISISTLVAASSLAILGGGNVFASESPQGTERLWTISEVKEIFHEYEAKRDECGGDYVCQFNALENLKQQDSKYGVLDSYLRRRFWISAVNPEQSTIRGYYQNYDYFTWEMRAEEWAMEGIVGEEIPREELYHSITELYACWLDPDYPDNWYFTNLRNGNIVDGLHPIIRAKVEVNGQDWFPAETEVEIAAPGARITENTQNIIRYNVWMGIGGTFTNSNDYSSCVNSPAYEPGMECQIRFKENGEQTYVPISIQSVSGPSDSNSGSNETGSSETNSGESNPSTDNQGNSSTDDPTNSANDNSTGTANGSNDAAGGDLNGDTNTATTDATSGTGNQNSNTVSSELVSTTSNSGAQAASFTVTPDTGEATAPQNNSIEFPWWIGAISLTGAAALVWLLWPNRRQSSKNS